MKPEELKIIAEGMGINVRVDGDYCSLEPKHGDTHYTAYNPLADDTQCMEIMEKLKITLLHDFVLECWSASKVKNNNRVIGEGKTINEAVCKAALEYFKTS